jgi:hypothetical protein
MGLSAVLRRRLRTSNEQGSILLITIVSVAVVALLGLAVYDLALIEAQFSAASVIDYRAYEIAQAGIERGIRELRNIYMDSPPRSESFARVTTTCSPSCNATQYHQFSAANPTVPPQAISAGPFAGAVDPGGTYMLELKYVTIPEANNSIDAVGLTYPFGLQCIPDSVFTAQQWCANLAFLRSTGTATDGAGNTRIRTIQTLVMASSTSPWAAGLVAGNGNPAVSGEVLIAGSVQILGGFAANPAMDIRGGGNAGMVNSWFPLFSSSGYSQAEVSNDTLSRLTPKQKICPPNTNCAGGVNLVESLGAAIRIFGNITNQMVNVGSGTLLGQSGPTALYGDPQRKGKGELDGVYIAAGCALPCIGGPPQPFNSGASVTVDRGNLTKPYPNRPPIGPLSTPGGAWPTLNDVVTIYNYATASPMDYGSYLVDWFAPHTNPGSGCAGCSAVIAGGTPVNAANCPVQSNCGGGLKFGAPDQLLANLTDGKGPFRHQFQFRDRGDNLQTAEICWMRDQIPGPAGPGTDKGTNPPPLNSRMLEFGNPDCGTPSSPANPVLLWIQMAWGIDRSSGSPYNYRGAAAIVTSGGVQIDETLQSYCSAAPCTGEKFPENHLLAVMATGNINLAMNRPNVNRIMGYFFVTGANITVKQDVVIAGMLRADNICFRNSAGCGGIGGGGKIPGFFQASFLDQRKIPHELPAPPEAPLQRSGGRWQVTSVPQFWIECRRGSTDTLPPTPSGICGYQ